MKKQPLIMGILNVTPDSFSDGGCYFTKEAAFQRAERLCREGADIIDVGGESTRPGAEPVTLQEELDRTIPNIETIHGRLPVRISIDTRHYEVAKEAIDHGATIINDVSAGSDIRMAQLAKGKEIDYILMHMQGTPQTMQQEPHYPRGAVTEVRDFLAQRVRLFQEFGVGKNHLWIDPGIGFGKTLDHNLELLNHLETLGPIGERLVIGTSRKSFLAHLLNDPDTGFEFRDAGTTSSNLWAYQKGASVFRVHEVGNLVRALKTWRAIEGAN